VEPSEKRRTRVASRMLASQSLSLTDDQGTSPLQTDKWTEGRTDGRTTYYHSIGGIAR